MVIDMKRMIGLFLSSFMVVGLTACGNQNNTSNIPTTQTVKESTTTQRVLEPSEQTSETRTEFSVETSAEEPETIEGKTLVVYYSATGNTEEVANQIAANTNAELFKLEPMETYSEDDLNWRDENSRVVYEYNNPDAREMELLSSTVEDWEAYDTIFIG